MDRAGRAETDLVTRKRVLHTLKGNTAMKRLNVIADLCHRAEDELMERGAVGDETWAALRARWTVVTGVVDAVLGDRARSAVSVDLSELEAFAAEIRAGASPQALLARLTAWRAEPVERPLARLGEYGRALAKRLERGDVEIEIDAADLRLDPKQWAGFWSVMVHVVRNAVDHGLDAPDEREAAGKPASPKLRLGATREAGGLVVEIGDDGRGIDWRAVERAAAARGMRAGTREDLVRALLQPDFTTRSEVSTTSGRGAGMAAVCEEVHRLGGTIDVESHAGRGTVWRFSFPSVGRDRTSRRPLPSGAVRSLSLPPASLSG